MTVLIAYKRLHSLRARLSLRKRRVQWAKVRFCAGKGAGSRERPPHILQRAASGMVRPHFAPGYRVRATAWRENVREPAIPLLSNGRHARNRAKE